MPIKSPLFALMEIFSNNILFLTPSDLWYYQIDLNEAHHRKTGSNLSLSGLDNNNNNIDKEIKTNENNNIKI